MKKIIYTFFLILLLSNTVNANDVSKVQVEVLSKTTKTWDGTLLPNYPKGQPEITILKVVIPPNTKLAVHKHPVINAGVLIKGELTVTTKDNKVLNMKEGEALTEVVNTWHHGENRTNKPVEILVFYAGVVGIPITVKK
mgnify:CR=1 FL=1